IPQKPQIFGHEQPIDEEKVARLICRSSGSKPAAQLRWRKGNREIKDSGTEVVEDPNGKTFTVTSRVEFRVTKEDNEVEVTCTVDHESLQNSERSTTQKLQVHCTWGGHLGGMEDSSTDPGQDVADLGPALGSCCPWGAITSQGAAYGRASLHVTFYPSLLILPFWGQNPTVEDGISLLLPPLPSPFSLPGSTAGWRCWHRMEPLGRAAASAPLQGLSSFCLFSPPAWADASPVPSTSSTYHAMIGGVVAVIVFLLLSLLIVLGHYLIRHKGTYLTHEAKGSDDAPDADTAIINAEGGQAGGDDKKEYFI
ncbi:CADM3 protein, partial [Pomatorhinus ruficollis]|nr:CADM3 protein [Pomatorhinus ruficollis]